MTKNLGGAQRVTGPRMRLLRGAVESPGHTGIQTQTGHGPEQPALVVPAPSSVGGHDDLQGSFQPRRACGVSQQKTLSTAMCVNCHPVGVPQAPESEQPGRCLRPLGPLSGGSVFTAGFFPGAADTGGNALPFAQPPRGRSSQLRVGSSPRTVDIFDDKQSWNKPKQKEKTGKIISGAGIRSQEAYLPAGCPLPSSPGTSRLHSAPRCCSVSITRAEGASTEKGSPSFPSSSGSSPPGPNGDPSLPWPSL